MRIKFVPKIILLIFLSFFMVINISSAMFSVESTMGQTIDTTRMLESNDVWTHYIPVGGTARITIEMNVVEGKGANIMLFSNAAYDKYVRDPLNEYPRKELSAINKLIESIFYSKEYAMNVYSNSFSVIVDEGYYVFIENADDVLTKVSHPSKVHLTIKYEPLFPVNTEGDGIDESRTIEQELYWAHSFIGGKEKSVKISVIEGGDADFYLLDEIGYKMYTDKESNRLTYIEQYTKLSNRSIAYDFTGNPNEKYYIIIDNSGRWKEGAYPKGPIKAHLEVQEQSKSTSGFELILAIAGFFGVSNLIRRKN